MLGGGASLCLQGCATQLGGRGGCQISSLEIMMWGGGGASENPFSRGCKVDPIPSWGPQILSPETVVLGNPIPRCPLGLRGPKSLLQKVVVLGGSSPIKGPRSLLQRLQGKPIPTTPGLCHTTGGSQFLLQGTVVQWGPNFSWAPQTISPKDHGKIWA